MDRLLTMDKQQFITEMQAEVARTEFSAFVQIAVLYHLKLGQTKHAEGQVQMLEQVVPDSEAVIKCRAMIAQHSLPKALAGLLRLMGRGRRSVA